VIHVRALRGLNRRTSRMLLGSGNGPDAMKSNSSAQPAKFSEQPEVLWHGRCPTYFVSMKIKKDGINFFVTLFDNICGAEEIS
jgi:hypothetical protein